jgi:hypothetical protein
MASPHHITQDDSSDNLSSTGKNEKSDVYSETPTTLLDEAELVTKRGNIVTKDGVVISVLESDKSLATNVFADPEVKAYYVGVYEKSQYECRHVFDADATWTEEEEKKVIRKLDWRGMCPHNLIFGTAISSFLIDVNTIAIVCLWACVMFFSLQVDRGNITQAVSGTFLKDLKLNTNGSYFMTVSCHLSILLHSLNCDFRF